MRIKQILQASLALTVLTAGTVLAHPKANPFSAVNPSTSTTGKSLYSPNIMEDLLVEDFEGGMPADWSEEHAPTSSGWHVGDADQASSDYQQFPDHTLFAWVNSDLEGEGATMDDYLYTPVFDASAGEFLFLEFESYFVAGSGDYEGFGEVLISVDGGSTWESVLDMVDTPDFETTTLELTDYLGTDMMQLAFHYWDNGNWAYGWGFDDMRVFTASGDEFPPEIAHTPVYNHLNPSDPIVISAEITDPSAILMATVYYAVDGGDYEMVDMTNSMGDIWDGMIPAQAAGSMVTYYISAIDLSDNANEAQSDMFDCEVNSTTWLHLDDGSVENSVGVAEPDGRWYGAAIYSGYLYYPLVIDQLEVFFSNPENDVLFYVWDLDANGMPNNELLEFSGDVVGDDFTVVDLPEPLEVTGDFAVGIGSAGNYLGVDENGYFFEGRTVVQLGTDPWAQLADFGFPGNYVVHPHIVNEESVAGERVATSFSLDQNYPNPFNPETSISYTLDHARQVSLVVYDVTGQRVAELVNDFVSAGSHQVTWNAANQTSGLYFYTLTADGLSSTRKMMLVK